MKMKDKQAIIVLSFAGFLLLWIIDACIDSLVFHETFLSSFFDFSPHELYFRIFVMLGLIAFGVVIIRMKTKRRLAENRYENLVELAADIIYVADKDGNQTFMNDAAYKILGYTPEQVIGRPWLELIHPDDREKTSERYRGMIEKNIDGLK